MSAVSGSVVTVYEACELGIILIAMLIGVTFLALAIKWLIRYTKYVRQINTIPGPKAHILWGNLLDLWVPHEDMFLLASKLALEPGHYMQRAWLAFEPMVGMIKCKAVEALLSSHIHIDKKFLYEYLHPWLGLGLLTSTGDRWHRRRKMLTPSFHFTSLEDFLTVFNEQSTLLLKELDRHVENETFNISTYFNLVALDIICLTAMGKSVQALQNKDCEYVKSIRLIGEIVFLRVYLPWLRPNWLFKLLPIGRKHEKCLKVLHSFSRKVIQDKRKSILEGIDRKNNNDNEDGCKKRLAFLDILLAGAAADQLTDADIQEEVDTFMFEGHHTTASALTWITYTMGTHMDVQKQVQDEIDQVIGAGEGHVTMGDLSRMKYLECCIKEALRLYPPVVLFSRHLNEPMAVGEYTVPAGTDVVINAYVLHRDPQVFPNPESFDPTRFYPENCVGRNPYAYVPFSAGPRNCIGQKYAMMEIKTVMCHLLRSYTVTCARKREDLKLYGELVLRPVRGLPISLKKRT